MWNVFSNNIFFVNKGLNVDVIKYYFYLDLIRCLQRCNRVDPYFNDKQSSRDKVNMPQLFQFYSERIKSPWVIL